MNKKQKASWAAWLDYNRAQQDYRTAAATMDRLYGQVEAILTRSGYALSSRALMMSRTSPVRIAERNELIERYNANSNGMNMLPNSEQTGQIAQQELFGDLLEDYDFSLGINPMTWVKSMGTGFVADAIEHPVLFAGSMLIAGATGRAAGTYIPKTVKPIVSRLITNGLIAANASIPINITRNITNKTLDAETSNLALDYGVDFVVGGVLSEIGRGIGKGVKYTYNRSKALTLQTKLNLDLKAVMEGATAAERAEFVSIIKEELPSSIESFETYAKNRDNLKKMANAYLDGNMDEMNRLMSETTGPFKPDMAAVQTIMPEEVKNGITTLEDNAREALKKAELLPKFNVDEFANSFKDKDVQTIIRDVPRTGPNRTERTFAYYLEVARNNRDTGGKRILGKLAAERFPDIKSRGKQLGGELRRLEEVVAKVFLAEDAAPIALDEALIGGIPYDVIERMASEQGKKKATELQKEFVQGEQIRRLVREIERKTGAKADTKLAVDSGSAANKERIKAAVKKTKDEIRAAALDFNRTIVRLQQIDTALRVAANAETTKVGRFLSGFTLTNNIRNSFTATLESEITKTTRASASLNSDIKDIVSKGLKSPQATATALDMRGLADNMILNTKGSGIEGAVASRLKKFLRAANTELARLGAPSIENVDNYLPNLWDTNKIEKAGKEAWVNTMMDLIDWGKTEAIAKQRKRAIKARKNWLGNMYERIKADLSPSRVPSQATGDIVSTGDRIIQLLDGDAWVTAHELYGKTTDPAEVIGIIVERVSKKQQTAALGLSNLNEGNSMIKSIFDGLRTISSEKREGTGLSIKQIERIKTDLDLLESQFQYTIDSKFGAVAGPEPRTGFWGFLQTVARKATLTTSFVTSFFTDYFGGMATLKKALGIRNGTLEATILTLKTLSKSQLELIAAVTDFLNQDLRNKLDSSSKSRIVKYGKYALNGPEIAGSVVSAFNSNRIQITYMAHLGAERGKSWDALPSQLRRFLSRHAITPAEWDIYRALPTIALDYGVHLLSSSNLSSRGIGNTRLLLKFANAERAAVQLGAPSPTEFGRAAKVRGGILDRGAEFAFGVYPFANITYSICVAQGPVLVDTWKRNKLSGAGLLLTLWGGGVLAAATKDILAGKNPTKDPMFLIGRGALLGGVFGQTGDFIIENLMGHTLAGAAVQGVPTLLKIAKNRSFKGTFKGASGTVSSLNPYRGTLLGQMIQRHTIDQFFAFVDPEGAEAADRELIRQVNNGEIYELRYRALKTNKRR